MMTICSFVDAPISGGQAGAENGQLSIMCGGDSGAFDRALPVMEVYAKICRRLGDSGAGQMTKMCNQIAIAGLVWMMLAPEIRGEMTTGQLVAFITAATTMAKPIRQVTSVHAKIQKGVAAAYDVFETIDESPEQDPGGNTEVRRHFLSE